MYFTLQYIRLRVCLKKAFPQSTYPALRKAFFKRAQKKSYISEILNVFLFQNYIQTMKYNSFVFYNFSV